MGTKKAGKAKLSRMIRDIKYCMLITVEPNGELRSRPMHTLEIDADGDLWFFTDADSPKAKEVRRKSTVNLCYVSEDQKKFVSVSGRAKIVRNVQKMKRLWKPPYRGWFPKGLQDPSLALLRVHVDHAEYWESPSTWVARLAGWVKALSGAGPASLGENKKIRF